MQSLPYGRPFYLEGQAKYGSKKIDAVSVEVYEIEWHDKKAKKGRGPITDSSYTLHLHQVGFWMRSEGEGASIFKIPISSPLKLAGDYQLKFRFFSFSKGEYNLVDLLVSKLQGRLRRHYEENGWLSSELTIEKLQVLASEMSEMNPDMHYLIPDEHGQLLFKQGYYYENLKENCDWIKANLDLAAIESEIDKREIESLRIWKVIKQQMKSKPVKKFMQAASLANENEYSDYIEILNGVYRTGEIEKSGSRLDSIFLKLKTATKIDPIPDEVSFLSAQFDKLSDNISKLKDERDNSVSPKKAIKRLDPDLRQSFSLIAISIDRSSANARTNNESVNVGTTFGIGCIGYIFNENQATEKQKLRLEPDLVTYTALKFYLSPRDKSLSDIRHVYPKRGSRIAVLIGVSTSGLLNFRGQTQDNSLSVTPLTGFSFDFMRAAEIDLGLIWFRQNTVSPISTRKVLKASAFIGLSWDFDILNRLTKK